MNWLDIIGIGLILPTVVAAISYILTRTDSNVKDLHSRIIKRLLSFCLGKDEPLVFQTILSLSLKEALEEIDHILTDGKSSQGKVRIDVAYRKMDANRKAILKNLRDEAGKFEKNKGLIWLILTGLITLYIILRIVLIK